MIASSLPSVSSLPAGLVPAPERLSVDAARALPVGTLVACLGDGPPLVGAFDAVNGRSREISVSFVADGVFGDGEEGCDFWPIAECAVLVAA